MSSHIHLKQKLLQKEASSHNCLTVKGTWVSYSSFSSRILNEYKVTIITYEIKEYEVSANNSNGAK